MRVGVMIAACATAVGCADGSDGQTSASTIWETNGESSGSTSTSGSTTTTEADSSSSGAVDLGPPPDPPVELAPCDMGSCWSQLTFSGICDDTTIGENFASGSYNVHAFPFSIRAGIEADVTLANTGGAWEPALVVHDEMGVTIYDGENGLWQGELTAEAIDSGQGSDQAIVRILSTADTTLTLFLTSWDVIDGDFVPQIPTDATYDFSIFNDCAPDIALEPPPNFDPNDVVGGYHLLPESEPPGLYNRKGVGCSRGNENLVYVLYTVAKRWNEIRPDFSPIEYRDLNENIAACGTDHMTHNIGIDADLVSGCATDVGCGDWIPALDLARLFIRTGEACGILFNDDTVQSVVNAYFDAEYGYEPWNGTFMRTVTGHTLHMHVRVMNSGGTCN